MLVLIQQRQNAQNASNMISQVSQKNMMPKTALNAILFTTNWFTKCGFDKGANIWGLKLAYL
jgi:hypothetical protein